MLPTIALDSTVRKIKDYVDLINEEYLLLTVRVLTLLLFRESKGYFYFKVTDWEKTMLAEQYFNAYSRITAWLVHRFGKTAIYVKYYGEEKTYSYYTYVERVMENSSIIIYL